METYVFLVHIKRQFHRFVKNAFKFCKKNVTAFVTHVKNVKCDKCVVNIAVSQGLAVTVYGGDCNTL